MKMDKTKKIAAAFLCAAPLLLAACGPAADYAQRAEDASPGSFPMIRTSKMTQEEADRQPGMDERITINTACGEVTGIQRDGYTEWRGIRYAVAERFELPVPVTGWEGTYDASVWGSRAPQYYGFYNMAESNVSQFYLDESTFQYPGAYSEDCLFLNIWAPDSGENGPVLVYIHGGSFLTGSNTDTVIDGEAFARRGIVMVAINYRLGPFHQVYGDGFTGNLALADQAAALHWIRDNIADYGGDPSRITVMGESAGAVSVQDLLISPLIEEGLLSGAVMMSGGGDLRALNTPVSPGVIEGEWRQVKNLLGAQSIQELKTVDAKQLYSAWLKCGGTAAPTVNGRELMCGVTEALDSGAVQDIPVIIGMLSEDMWPYTLYKAAAEYAAQRARAGGAPVYLYYFDRQIDKTFGAFHAGDLYYMFGTLCRSRRVVDETDCRISEAMISYLSHFVKTGNPNGPGLTIWEPAGGETIRFMHFGDKDDGMISPDTSLLSKNEATRSPFPYAMSIQVNPTSSGKG